MNDYVIIVAGGKGLRMGGEIPKQFLPIGGKPVLMRTIERFYHSISGINIILVLPVDQQSYWCQLCKDYSFDIPHTVANGGATRFHSVSNGLALVPDDTDDVVGVHDGVRPFVSAEVIRKAYEVARREETAIPVIPIVETVRQLQDEGRSKTVDRSSYRLVQTPQTFSVSLLKRAYGQTYNDFFTDDASVVEALGYEVSLVEGNKENIKITTPSDLKFAEWICQQR